MAGVPAVLVQAFERGERAHHRTIAVLIGPDTKQAIPHIHARLSRVSPLREIIWCYRNAETAMDSLMKRQKRAESDTELMEWVKEQSPDHVSYKDGQRLLGRTCDMLVLQDFEALTANLLATSIETVRGGGLIVLLLDQAKTLAEVVSQSGKLLEAQGPRTVPRFNRRLFRLLAMSGAAIFLDNGLNRIEVQTPQAAKADTAEAVDTASGKPSCTLSTSPDDSSPNAVITAAAKTADQHRVLSECLKILGSTLEAPAISAPAVTVLTAARGRGKTALLGLAAAYALHGRVPYLAVTAPFPENVQTLFEHAARGLQLLGHRRGTDYRLVYATAGKTRLVTRLELPARRQALVYHAPADPRISRADVLFIDEAAAIPFAQLKEMLSAAHAGDTSQAFLSTTVGGYEGTGRAFTTKLAAHLESGAAGWRAKQRLEMLAPIRYAAGDPAEAWLERALLLSVRPAAVPVRPLPREASFYYVHKSLLFSGAASAELVLNEIFGVLAASHYRNSPDDLQILADARAHELFALLAPDGRVLAAVQVAVEGPLDLKEVRRQGNLIPWVVYDAYRSQSFAAQRGVRVVRIAVHPHLFGTGYGSEVLRCLENWFAGAEGTASGFVEPGAGATLFAGQASVQLPAVAWFGASFGVSEQLYRFWKRAGFEAVGIKQEISRATGAHSCVVLKAASGADGTLVAQLCSDFKQRFIELLGYSFRQFPASLCLAILVPGKAMALNDDGLAGAQHFITPGAAVRLSNFAQGVVVAETVLDLFPALSRAVFGARGGPTVTSVLQYALLAMVGCQRYTVREAAQRLQIEEFQASAALQSLVTELLKVVAPS